VGLLNILTLNAGSSTLKFGLHRIEPAEFAGAKPSETLLAWGIVERVGTPQASLKISLGGQEPVRIHVVADTPLQAARQVIPHLLELMTKDGQHPMVDAVGCRVVHGGARFTRPTLVNASVLEDLRALSDLAPLHNPADVAVIETCLSLLPDAPTVAVFDTAFHHTLPKVASTYALPLELSARYGLRRYGFHGISHRYVSERLLECLGRGAEGTRVISCHLGSGASVCAIRDGRSIDTSMGLTPMEGLVMGTRSGDVDPGLILFLMRTAGLGVKEVDDALNCQSGLRGLSALSDDLRDLERAAAEGHERAELALQVFAYRLSKYIGAYTIALEGLDALIFTGASASTPP
jgi:acetate kinase